MGEFYQTWLRALQATRRAHVIPRDRQPNPQPHQEERHYPDVSVVDELRRDEAGELRDGARALLRDRR